ncbi:MAG: tetratricopeptide repeat protein, partial [Bdellovibrionales bacterium]|nr:tetratricopeptide repeat protein [Bdellovibrionales bacterium]
MTFSAGYLLRFSVVSLLGCLIFSGCSLFQRKKEIPGSDPQIGTLPVPKRVNFSPVDSSYASGQLQEALKALEPILKMGNRNPDYPLAVYRAARIHEALSDWTPAIALYRNLLSISLRSDAGTKAEILRRIALCHEGAGDHRRALLAWLDLSKNPSLSLPVKNLEVP